MSATQIDPALTGTTFSPTLEEFKRMVGEFVTAAPTCDADSLENGLKAVSLGYLGLKSAGPHEVLIAVSYLQYASRRFSDRSIAITMEKFA